ncbi:MAG: alpha/beta hydrolase fold family protein, partial [Eubacterium sp.]|nr:alpha/beta hydrolase fold family protein [Eubacterium sp.]
IYELMIEQNEYYMSKGLASQAQIDFIKGQVNILKDPGFYPAQPPKEYQLGTPYYYDDMTNYDVLGMAKTLKKPMLVLQGEKDWQVSVKSDFEGWKKAFESNKSAQFKLYPELNHVYTNINITGTINDYYIKANLPQYLIDDIGSYINQVAEK